MIDGQALSWDELEASQAIDPEWVTSGRVEEASKIVFTSDDHKFVVQIWESHAAVELDIEGYPADEFATIISGSLELIGSQSESKFYGPGDSLLIPKGFCGRWIQKGPVRKYSVSYLV
ncbi:MAG: hypothetical protein COA41_06100 [Sphingopyxis sp.]|jgi:uncharacterized cupin superfamily protein|nr:MAG: hypothetical protein COA41_06100 [Sphingopyxis sp.]|tara:strand:+ start:7241 stop:7594 length:354 start_codon:yes stop_codon:yes gene_type:complete